jgi:NAD(P)-dependent dehydrogenase (short-subunit alcohol dehydrogenase family)
MAPTPNGRMANKVAIVTGAGSRAEGIGNGRASAILLARQGAKGALVDGTQTGPPAPRR